MTIVEHIKSAIGLIIRSLRGLMLAAAAAVTPPQDDMIGHVREHVTIESDTLLDVARDYSLGYVEIVAANPEIDPWLPGPGAQLVLPTEHLLPSAPRRGIVINLADQRLYFFPPQGRPESYPIGIPASDDDVRVGAAKVVAKRVNPTWIPPLSLRARYPELPSAVPPGPANPLGAYALDLDWENIVIHGTNRPYGVGRRVSSGCFRLHPKDIAALFKQVPLGLEVTVVDQPVKVGWHDRDLYMEVHPSLAQASQIEALGRFTPAPAANLERLVREAAGPLVDRVDWRLVDRTVRQRTGVPVRILQ